MRETFRCVTASWHQTGLGGTVKPQQLARMGVGHSWRKELQMLTPCFWEDLPRWTQSTAPLRVFLGKAEITTPTNHTDHVRTTTAPPRKYKDENTHSFRKMNLSTDLLYGPKLWSLGPWFVQAREVVLENKLSWLCEYSLVQSRTVYYGSVQCHSQGREGIKCWSKKPSCSEEWWSTFLCAEALLWVRFLCRTNPSRQVEWFTERVLVKPEFYLGLGLRADAQRRRVNTVQEEERGSASSQIWYITQTVGGKVLSNPLCLGSKLFPKLLFCSGQWAVSHSVTHSAIINVYFGVLTGFLSSCW